MFNNYLSSGDLPSIVIHALCSVLLVIKNTLDHFVISFINFKINLVLQEKEVVEIIELARGLFVCLSLCLFVCLSVCLFVCLFVCLLVCVLFVSLLVC